MLEYVRERGERIMRGLEHARRECKDRNKWRLFCHGHTLTGGVLRNRHQDIDRDVKRREKQNLFEKKIGAFYCKKKMS